MALVWGWLFYPDWRTELPSSGPENYRAFVVPDVAGTSIPHVSDWPRTFFLPLSLEDYIDQSGERSLSFYWSRDGSVFAAKIGDLRSPEIFSAAYDYRSHSLTGQSGGVHSPDAIRMDQQIGELMIERGEDRSGIEVQADLRTDLIPNHVWLLPLGIVLAGSFLSGHFQKYW